MKKTLLSLVLVLLASVAFAAPAGGDARSVLNAFVATFAKDNPAWKGDIVAIADPSNVPPGRQLGYSAVLGYYTFIPKTWEQLSEAERQQVYSDPRLKAFLVSLRNYNNYPSMTGAETPRPAFGVYPVDGMGGGYPMGYGYPQPMSGGYQMPAPQAPMPAAYPSYYPAYPQPYAPQGGYAPQASYMSPAGYMYSPAQMAATAALVQPVTLVQPIASPYTRLQVMPEEMLLDRPVNVYMQNRR